MVTWLTSGLISFLNFVLQILPDWEPPDLAGYVVRSAGEYLGALNWFFPVSGAVALTVAWAIAIVGYELYLWVTSILNTVKGLK